MAKQKETDETIPPVADSQETAALRAQNDLLLDGLIELRDEIEALKAQRGQPTVAAAVSQAEIEAAELKALMAEFKDVPNIQLLENRIRFGQDAPAGIRLKAAPGGIPEATVTEDPTGDSCYWKLRWFNFSIEGRAERFVSEGYLKVDVADLQDLESIPNLTSQEGHVRKGERGLEVLGKIPRKVFIYKKRRDAERQGRLMQSESGLRGLVANRVAADAGNTGGNADQAGSFAHDGMKMTITQGEKERVTF